MPGTDFSKLPVWKRMGVISLDEMDSIKLMNRIDTKFVTNESTLLSVLDAAADQGYRVCTIEGLPVTAYYSVYYDTPDLFMYTAHETGRKTRQKIRVRTYLISGDTYLEVKRKQNNGRTKKKRIPLPVEERMDFSRDAAAAQFLAEKSWFKADGIFPECTTEFNRITLVNAAKTERLTIDMNLKFHNFSSGRDAGLKDAVIIELKQDGREASQMKGILLEHRIHPFRISKYCMGVMLTDPRARSNRFKEKLRMVEKIINDKIDRYESNS